MKDNLNKIDQDARTVYWIILEKLSIVLCLIIVFAGALALGLPWWAVGAILGFSLGPIVYGHYYFIYIRLAKKTGRLMGKVTVSVSEDMGLFGDFLDLIGLGGITGVDILFAAMAIVGTFLFIIYFLLILIGDFTGGLFDFVDADGIFHLFTIQGLLSFIMMFGIFGLSVSADQNAFVIIAGTIAGTFSMYIVGKVFQMMASLNKIIQLSIRKQLALEAPFTEPLTLAN